MNPTHINKICEACFNYIIKGKAENNKWLQTKKDILNKWKSGYYLSPEQTEIITKMYNIEVLGNTSKDWFSNSKPKLKATKKLPKSVSINIYDDIPF